LFNLEGGLSIVKCLRYIDKINFYIGYLNQKKGVDMTVYIKKTISKISADDGIITPVLICDFFTRLAP